MPELLQIGPALSEGGGGTLILWQDLCKVYPTHAEAIYIVADVLTTWQRSRVQTTLGSVVESFHLTR